MIAVLMGVFVGPLFDACMDAAAGVIDPSNYVRAVLVVPQLGGDAP
ncbi:MAG: hypothetical protein HC927_13475 [Deltaproteobacteria bacterium]|nr:hypothetical protein [Deltaproteobacteria bacterium]